MKKLTALIACAAFAVGTIPLASAVRASDEPPAPEPAPAPTAPSCADVCGYAVINSDGVVHGVIVCQQGCFNVTMPIEYMGCPVGCSLVLQAPADNTGNVAGVFGPNVVYSPQDNTFTRTGSDGQMDWQLVSGQPLENALVPTTTTPPAPEQTEEQPPTAPEMPAPTTEAPTTTTAPQDSTLQTLGVSSTSSQRSVASTKSTTTSSKKRVIVKKRPTTKTMRVFIK
jgi:hypothetical protein